MQNSNFEYCLAKENYNIAYSVMMYPISQSTKSWYFLLWWKRILLQFFVILTSFDGRQMRLKLLLGKIILPSLFDLDWFWIYFVWKRKIFYLEIIFLDKCFFYSVVSHYTVIVALSFCSLGENTFQMHISPPTQNCHFHFLIEISIMFDFLMFY